MYQYLSMEKINTFIAGLPTWVIVLLCIIVFMGIVGQWALYSKCDLPGFAALVPVWNVSVFLRIVGRPSNQGWLVMVPPLVMLLSILFIPNLIVGAVIGGLIMLPWAWFMIKVYVEVCQSFGKRNMSSYILIVIFNGLYLFNLALSQDEKYEGPIYKDGDQPKLF